MQSNEFTSAVADATARLSDEAPDEVLYDLYEAPTIVAKARVVRTFLDRYNDERFNYFVSAHAANAALRWVR